MAGESIEKRGGNWYLRWRVPKEFRAVETRREINVSLKTDSKSEAQGLASLAKGNLKAMWNAKLAGKVPSQDRATFDALMALGRSRGLSLRTPEQIAAGPLEEITKRLDLIQAADPRSTLTTFVLGGVDLPSTLVSEMADEMARIRSDDVGGKNDRQLREWNNKWKRATKTFVACVGDKPVTAVILSSSEARNATRAHSSASWTANLSCPLIAPYSRGRRSRASSQHRASIP